MRQRPEPGGWRRRACRKRSVPKALPSRHHSSELSAAKLDGVNPKISQTKIPISTRPPQVERVYIGFLDKNNRVVKREDVKVDEGCASRRGSQRRSSSCRERPGSISITAITEDFFSHRTCSSSAGANDDLSAGEAERTFPGEGAEEVGEAEREGVRHLVVEYSSRAGRQRLLIYVNSTKLLDMWCVGLRIVLSHVPRPRMLPSMTRRAFRSRIIVRALCSP